MTHLRSRSLPRLHAEIQVTPWIDLMLILLLCVLILVPVMKASKWSLSSRPSPRPVIELKVEPDLGLRLDGQKTPEEMLIPDLARIAKKHPELGVNVKVPESLKAAALTQLMHALETAKVKHTSFTTY